VAAWTIIAHLARLGITREISIRYLKPVPTNTELVVEGQIVSHDEKSAVLRSTVHSAGGRLLAESESKWMFPRLSGIAKIARVDESMLQQFLARYHSSGPGRK
jgi:acyl-CoA thioesterase FadM